MEKQEHAQNKNANGSGSGEVRAYCGFFCSKCPAYSGNIHGESDRNRVHETWKKIYGLDIPPEVLCCDGCLKPDNEHPHRIGGNCPMRTCVLEKGIAHCGFCTEFPCDLIERHMASVETVVPECRKTLTDQEFKDFIEPYLCRNYLEEKRK